jgi:hypothetical protein
MNCTNCKHNRKDKKECPLKYFFKVYNSDEEIVKEIRDIFVEKVKYELSEIITCAMFIEGDKWI